MLCKASPTQNCVISSGGLVCEADIVHPILIFSLRGVCLRMILWQIVYKRSVSVL